MSNNKSQENVVFISYAREDFEEARRLYEDLRKAGLTPWLDKKELLPGQNWENEIEDAISKSRYFITLFSKTSVKKIGYVQNEFKFALEVFRRYPPNMIFYIPVRLDDCDIPYKELRSIHHADLFPVDDDNIWKEGIKQILRAIRNEDDLPLDTIKQNKVQNSSIHDFKLSNTGNITYTGTWSCQVCGKPFPSYQAYREHFSNEHR